MDPRDHHRGRMAASGRPVPGALVGWARRAASSGTRGSRVTPGDSAGRTVEQHGCGSKRFCAARRARLEADGGGLETSRGWTYSQVRGLFGWLGGAACNICATSDPGPSPERGLRTVAAGPWEALLGTSGCRRQRHVPQQPWRCWVRSSSCGSEVPQVGHGRRAGRSSTGGRGDVTQGRRAAGARARGACTRPAGCGRRRCGARSSRGRRPDSRRRCVLRPWPR